MDRLEGLCPEVDPEELEGGGEILDEVNDNGQTETKEIQNVDTFLGEQGSRVEEEEREELEKGR